MNLCLAGAALALGGCLETKEAVFDASNSVPVAEQARFMEFVTYMDEAGPRAGGDPEDSPSKLLESEAVAVDLGGLVLVQSAEEDKFTYSAVGVLGGRAFMCSAMPDEETKAAAAAYDVSIIEQAGQGPGEALQLEGDREKVAAFIRDQLETGPLVCMSVSKGRRFAPQ